MTLIISARKIVDYCFIIGVSFALVSCASTKPPTQDIAKAEAAINQAEQVDAKEYAPLEIRKAQKKLEKAKKLMQDGKFEKARRLADRAEVDAELAEAKALSAKAQNAVRQLRESIKILKEEISRNQQK